MISELLEYIMNYRTRVAVIIVLGFVFVSWNWKYLLSSPQTFRLHKAGKNKDEKRTALVKVKNGLLLGSRTTLQDGRDVYSFLGVPFAKPPLGHLRFCDPEAPEAWEGVKDATQWPPSCPYISHYSQALHRLGDIQGKEDCLYLNVFSPSIKKGTSLPVLVFIHGGSFLTGSVQRYQPMPLLSQDVLLVTIQYRLNVLGFLSTEDEEMPGNYGLKDQVLALRWVRENIAALGGDPERVTVTGNSAGAASVHLLLMNPHAKGLFSRAMMLSGNALDPWAVRTGHRNITFKMGHMVGCPTKESGGRQASQALRSCLQNVPYANLVPAFVKFFVWSTLPWVTVPRVDGDHLPGPPARLLQEGRFHKMPIITGVAQDEGLFVVNDLLRSKALRESLTKNFSVLAPWGALLLQTEDPHPVHLATHMFHHFIGTTNITHVNSQHLIHMFGDRFFKVGHEETVHYTTIYQNQPVFSYEAQRDNPTYAYVQHGWELGYLFSGSQKLYNPYSHILVKLYTNFAATGDPTPDASLGFKWSPATTSSDSYLAITSRPAMKKRSTQEISRRKFWRSLPTRQNQLLHPELSNQYLHFFDLLPSFPAQNRSRKRHSA